ncbi:MAG: hypothetical protein V3R46_01535, partial [Thermoplasmata archaeon]
LKYLRLVARWGGEFIARPFGVTILAVLAILAAIPLLIVGSSTVIVAAIVGLTPGEVQLIQALGTVSIVLGILYLVGGVGLLRLAVWGWWVAILASLISLASTITQAVINPGAFLGTIFGLVLALFILGYLYVVRGEFGSAA